MQDFPREIMRSRVCVQTHRFSFLSCRRKPLPITRWNISKLTPAWPWCSHALTTGQSCDHGYVHGNVFNSLYPAIATCHDLSYIAGFSYVGGADSYQKSAWSLGDKYIKEYNDWFLEQQTQFLLGRYRNVSMGLFFSTWLSLASH